MAILVIFEFPGMTQADYQQSVVKVTGGRDTVKNSADWPVPGLISHTAAPTADGWIVADVWESEEAFQKFGEIIVPILTEIGIKDAQPKTYPVFNLVTP
ncbi:MULTISPECIES: hypothetical protein [unclassified Streptomyces]|uniref:hypothetical protein n=1 Tax=unclassified Streptomyces TaxID=2593676 RepID=UPI002034933A|nr:MULTISPECIES: hypothetical protein [unclassified Streptomyces]MCM2419534.1 hypothetical protein [Streptomyces sp. RKAG293]MCM2428270.1 hypothetical protein [Streptomyces sp. RKAG337]